MTEKPDREYSKIEQDVLDALKDVDLPEDGERPGNVVDFKRPKRRPRLPAKPSGNALKQLSSGLTPAKMLIATVAFALGAVFLQSVSGTLSMILIVAAIAAFLGLFVVRSKPGGMGSTPSQPQVKRWRGRDIYLEPRGKSERSGSWRRFLPRNRR